MYTVYTIPGTCSSGITALLEKLQVEYSAVKRDDVDNYSGIVPTNQVPALKTEDGQIITEGAAIVLYLLEKHDSSMLPTELGQKAEFLRWLMFNYATLHPAYGKMFAILYRVELGDAEKNKVLEQLSSGVTGLWAILDKELERKEFITGSEPTVVDYLATVYASWGRAFKGIDIPLGKNVERMVTEVAELPEFKAAYKREGLEYLR